MSTSETVAVKVLATYSTGEQKFHTEDMFCGSKESLASHLYSEKHEPLNWDLRVYIALRGLEYLRDGNVPPVINRDQIFPTFCWINP
ncbi:unnamed protein product [Arabidopsis arenosa]|uniref:Uncharacterized protein n=1 Tax=Arabidopsis arenosa TaxID=38785 RepID=A0A8S2A0C2_ARAAE|nr:unnamed protein product [Arabidopsis arenosa]